MASLLLNIGFWVNVIKYGWPFVILLAIVMSWQLGKKWPIEAIIFEKRGANILKTNDRAGRISERGFVHYKLMKSKDSIPILNYDWVLHNVVKPTSIWEKIANTLRGTQGTIILFRYGSKQYKPIKVGMIENENGEEEEQFEFQEIMDKNGNPIFINNYIPLDPRKPLSILDFEVVDWDNMNFMVQEWGISEERRKSKGDFWKQVLVPLGAIALAAVVCIFMFKFSYDYATKGLPAQYSPQPTPIEQLNQNNPMSGVIPAG